MRKNEFGAYEPRVRDRSPSDSWGPVSLRVCPFADQDADEDSLGEELFAGQEGIQKAVGTGYYLDCYVGSVADEQVRMGSVSGGLLSWFAGTLLRRGLVDAVICVGTSSKPDRLFEYRIVRTAEELLADCRKSSYYPVECSGVLERVLGSSHRFCFMGVPCFCKGIRLAMRHEPTLRERIPYVAGLFCSAQKTDQFAKYLSRCCGVSEEDIASVDFRKKAVHRRADDYAFEVVRRGNGLQRRRWVRARSVLAASWGYYTFMVDACHWCDDTCSELADVAVGDAWLPQFARDYRGTSIAICRRSEIVELFQQGLARGELAIQPLDVEQVKLAQAPGLRHKGDGLAYRLHLAAKRGQWRPRKRVDPDGESLSLFYKCVQRMRLRLTTLSKRAYLRQQQVSGAGVSTFVRNVWPWVKGYDLLYAPRVRYRQARRLVQLVASKLGWRRNR